MKQHEREYFVSRIRLGEYWFKRKDVKLTILTPTVEDELESNIIYNEAYESSFDEGCMTVDDNLKWMIDNKLWSEEEDAKIKTIREDVEKLKIKIYEERVNTALVKTSKLYLQAANKALDKLFEKKNKYFSKTCEGIATSEKSYELTRRCTYSNGLRYGFNEYSIDFLTNFFYSQLLSETSIRLLARSEPWRTLWNIYEDDYDKLFLNKDRELSVDQKNMVIWSKMYDNIQESMDCPENEVIEDDDMLDGWFLVQSRKRQQEKKEKGMEDKLNGKVANSQEVFLMASDKESAKKIDEINSAGSKAVKQRRFAQIRKQGKVNQIDFQDEQLKLKTQAAQGMKNNFRR